VKIPNFFIVGAPKAGTTALFTYLREHPNIYMPMDKEPHYFAKDFPDYPSVKTEDEYLKLFKHCTSNHKAIGEASVWYLYSEVAIKLIYEFNPSAKIIAMLRNPIDLAYAMHNQAIYNYNEDEPDFEKAWKLQSIRAKQQRIPQGCRAHQILQYKKLSSLGYQVERLFNIFPHEQIKILFLEEFIQNMSETYEGVLKFLEVPPDGRIDFPKVNQSKTHRSKYIGWLTQTPPKPIIHTVRFARNHLGLNINRPLRWIRHMNDKPKIRKELSPEFRKELVKSFQHDTKKLSLLLNKNLEEWLH
jgi:hypothetical protein